jgi:sec-independent protein translocase protein TatA
MRLGLGEILIILVVVLLIFGANKIPQLGDALGKGIRNFRKASREDDSIDVTPEKKQPSQLGATTPASQPSSAGAEKKA